MKKDRMKTRLHNFLSFIWISTLPINEEVSCMFSFKICNRFLISFFHLILSIPYLNSDCESPNCNRKKTFIYSEKKKKVFRLLYIYMCVYGYICVCASEGICNKFDCSVFFSDFTLLFCIFYKQIVLLNFLGKIIES